MENVGVSSLSCSNPPFPQTYKFLSEELYQQHHLVDSSRSLAAIEDTQTELPTIDLEPLINGGDSDKVAKCKKDIAQASAEWGFFQVVNHGISSHILEMMRSEAEKLFDKPFEEKKALMGVSSGIKYFWGAPKATSIDELSWTEVFRIPVYYLFIEDGTSTGGIVRLSIDQYARKATELASLLIKALADELGRDSMFFDQNCNPGMSFIILNKYPPCPIAPDVHGKRPHTDNDFLTILYQDNVGGLQVWKDEKWINVKPNPATLIVNVGDLLQMWSNDVYKSVKHRVLTSHQAERYSVAYFLAPSRETVIESNGKPGGIYKPFTYGEYKDQLAEDVRKYGNKVGLNRFLASQNN